LHPAVPSATRRGRIPLDLENEQFDGTECQFVTDTNGEKTGVILPVEEYEELLEDLHVPRAAEETKDEPHRLFISDSRPPGCPKSKHLNDYGGF
jgi:hypothetical protein